MPISLSLENISSAFHQSAAASAPAIQAAPAAAGGADAGGSAGAASTANTVTAASDPSSGATQLPAGFTVVVMSILNEQGNVVATIPSAQQLAAYRNGTATPPSAS